MCVVYCFQNALENRAALILLLYIRGRGLDSRKLAVFYLSCAKDSKKTRLEIPKIFFLLILELRQYKNDWIAGKYLFVLKLARFFTRLYSAH